MSKETNAIKTRAKMWAYISVGYSICAIYLGLTSFAMHKTLEEIDAAVIGLIICGSVALLCAIAYLIIGKKKEPEEIKDGKDE